VRINRENLRVETRVETREAMSFRDDFAMLRSAAPGCMTTWVARKAS
jgi:hypothetical protein